MKNYQSKENDLRNRVYSFQNLHTDKPKCFIVNHFLEEGVARSTLYKILKRKENGISHLRKSGSGRVAKKMTKQRINQLKKQLDHKTGVSQRMLAKRFNVSKSYMNEIIKTKTNIRYYKKFKVPKRTEKQKAEIRPKCSFLTSFFRNKAIIVDDESYFKLSNCQLSGNSGFYSSNKDKTPDDVKLKRVAKFESKLLVWIALTPDGLTKPFIAKSGQSICSSTYISNCLDKILVPYINEHFNDGEYVFWPDMASCHYSNETQEFMKSKNINFVPKERNIANVPELRPIEDFWSELKRKVYDKCWQAKNLNQLERRIRYCLNKMNSERIQKLSSSTFKRVDNIRRHGKKNL